MGEQDKPPVCDNVLCNLETDSEKNISKNILGKEAASRCIIRECVSERCL